MYHFFVEPSQISENDKRVIIYGSDVNHIKNVLRMKIGEELNVGDGVTDREYRCAITSFGEDSVLCELRFIKENNVELPAKITLFQGLPKADKMELIIQKAVELGAAQIVPVATKRCVVKLDDKKAASKISRWQGISEAAAKQSKRSIIPEVTGVMSFKEAIRKASDMSVRIIPYELAEDMEKTRDLLNAVRPGDSIAVFIGPEGGFDESEIAYALENGVEPITLGRRILRTETAGFTVLAWLSYLLEGRE
ncbi:MAG: 16S rRNA (uracil(1498)-N(3))-methyltransferase [Acetatifactor sp.]|nr:16S rRNA (uracil(1498)-N(3))-methyltransferase [Acetatifactor sp.]